VAARKKARRKAVEPASMGLSPAEVEADAAPPEIEALEARIRATQGAVLAHYREPVGGSWIVLAALPVSRVAPTPFQRDRSDAHLTRLEDAIQRVGTFLDPIIAVPAPEAAGTPEPSEGGQQAPRSGARSEPQASEGGQQAPRSGARSEPQASAGGQQAPRSGARSEPQASEVVQFWTPNGTHRLSALQRMGAKTVTALVSPDPTLAYRILALNTEKAHNTKERALEAVRMARGLAELDPGRRESEFALELEDGSLVTLGHAYEERPRFAGGAYAPALKASDHFLDEPIAEALELRRSRALRLLAIDDRVAEIIEALKARGFESPYLRNFVVARIRPFRPRGKPAPAPDALLDHMQKAADKFDPNKTKTEQIAQTPGATD
jgi:ParB family chromosome partitioning protein